MVFQNDRHANGTVDANGPNITYVPVSAAGGLLSPIGVADFNAGSGHDALQNAAIATLSSGRQVVAFERVWTADVDHDVFLNVVNAAGTATQFSIANPLDVQANASWQANPAVAAIGNQALVVFEDGTGTTTSSANIRGRFFDGTSNTLGAAFTIANHTARLRTADVAAIDDHRYAIVYGNQNDVWAKIYDATTGTLSPEVQVDAAGGFALNPAVARLPGDRFVVTWAEWNGADYDARARLFDSTGAPMGSNFIVTSLTNNSQFTPDVAVSGHEVFFSWTDFAARPEDSAAPGIRGRVFHAGTASESPHWMASVDVGPHPGGWLPSGIGDFNRRRQQRSRLVQSEHKWHRYLEAVPRTVGRQHGCRDASRRISAGRLRRLQSRRHQRYCSGTTRQPATSISGRLPMANGPAARCRHASGGLAAERSSAISTATAPATSPGIIRRPRNVDIWQINNGQWAGSVDVGSHPAGYQPVAYGDFNGDGTSDIGWYNATTGDVDIWKISNGQWAGSISVGSHPAGWQPLGAADFNLDGTSDIVWYNPTTNNIDIWLINNGQWAGSFDIGSHPAGSVAVGVGDFDHNDVSDIMWRNTTSNSIENWMLASS